MKPGRYDIKRGRHKKAASRETRDWLDAPPAVYVPPEPPPWMDGDTANKLLALRRQLDPWTPT